MSHPDYAISYQPLSTTLQSLDIQALIDQAGDPWCNQTLIQVGDVLVRLGVMQDEFHWHKHDQQDEFFLALDGLFRIELDGANTIELRPRSECATRSADPSSVSCSPAARGRRYSRQSRRMPLPR